jgi:NADH-quinone oxidoreductase subunit J
MLDLFFYLFSAVAVLSCLMVIFSSNAVHSVLYLILAYFNVAGLFVLIGAEFMAMLLMVVYVGAVAVLFLFVVMMLDIDHTRFKQGFYNHLPAILLVSGIFVAELVFSIQGWLANGNDAVALYSSKGIKDIGKVLYTDYIFYFQMSGLILLVAMIGAIGLTLRKNTSVKRQNIYAQVTRSPSEALELTDPAPSTGLKG